MTRIFLKLGLVSFLLFIPFILIMQMGYINDLYLNIILNQTINTFKIIFSVVLLTMTIGGIISWLFSMYDFPLKKPLEIILILGMVFPSYVLAFFYSEAFNIFGEIALVITMVVATLPYVFMIVTMSIRNQSQQLFYSAMMIGKDDKWVRFKVILPLIKPAFILSSLLVFGDTFSEFGATYFYGVDTVMTGIYEIWFGLHESEQGIRFASWIFIVIVIMYYFINVWKKNVVGFDPTLSNNSGNYETINPKKITGIKAWITTIMVMCLTILTFIIPMCVLGVWVYESYLETNWLRVLQVTLNSTILSTTISVIVVIIATFILYLFKRKMNFITTISNSLYATPGIVLSISAVFVFYTTTPFLVLLVFVYILVLKYLAMGIDSIGVSIQKINREYYYSAKTLGKDTPWYIKKIQIPISIQGYIVAGILVWTDVIRELVIGLTIRPQWLELLSVEIYRYMDMEILYMSGPWILSMVLITLIPISYIHLVMKVVK